MSHVHRALLVADRLADRGHEVMFAVRDDHRIRVAAAGFAAVACEDVTVQPTEDAYACWSADRIMAGLDQLVSLIEAFGADVVVADFHPLAAIAAEAAGVPSVALATAGLTNGAARLTGVRGPGLWATSQLLGLRGRHDLRSFATAARARRLQRPRDTYARLFAGDVTVVTELRTFVGDLGDDVAYGGPLIWNDTGPSLPPPPAGVARVYITLGNTGDPSLVGLAVEALAGRPGLQLVITTGHLVDPPEAPEGVIVVRSLAGAEVMRHARLVVHSGGVGTTYQALAAGVPMVVIPHVPGQQITAHCATRRGVGVGLRVNGLQPERLRDVCCRMILHRAAADRAGVFAVELATTDGARSAAMSVEHAALH